MSDVSKLHQQYVMQSWSKSGAPALAISDADGIYLWDYDGNKYADMSSLLVNANLGHKNIAISDALKAQIDKFCFLSPPFATEPKSLLAKKLVDIAGADTYKRVFFTSGGGEANENAIKMARMATGRTKIFSGYRSYHGATLGAAHASGDWRRFSAELGGATGFVHFLNPYVYQDGYTMGVDDDVLTQISLKDLELKLIYEGPQNVAAILVEPIVGGNGVILPPTGYLEGIRALCDKYDILMICDEVMTGFFRTGKWFCWQNYNLKPDIITFAKGVNSGYVPLGGVIVNDKVASYFEQNVLQCGLTYSGHTLACAAGVASIDYYIEHDIEGHVAKMHTILAEFMDEMLLKHKCVGDVRCMGLFGSIEIVSDKQTRTPIVAYGKSSEVMPRIFGELRKRGYLTFGRENNICMCPPLIITEEQLNEYLPYVDEVLSIIDSEYLA